MAKVRIIPTETFDGYPDGVTRTPFVKGVEVSVTDSYAKLLVDQKKMAVRVKKSPDKE